LGLRREKRISEAHGSCGHPARDPESEDAAGRKPLLARTIGCDDCDRLAPCAVFSHKPQRRRQPSQSHDAPSFLSMELHPNEIKLIYFTRNFVDKTAAPFVN
jgi:hypothetical protein